MPDPKTPGLMETLQHRLPSNGWTVETVLQHVLSLYAESDRRYSQRFTSIEDMMSSGFEVQRTSVASALAAAERATAKAERAAEKRFEGVNEFRAVLSDQQQTLMPRSEVVSLFSSMSDRTASLQKQMDAIAAERSGVKGGYGYAVGVVGFVLAILAVLFTFARFGITGGP